MVYFKNIKIGALLGVFFSFIIICICLIDMIFSTIPLVLLSVIVIYTLIQTIIFILSSLLLINFSKFNKYIFIIGLFNLFAILVPGLIILITYFKEKKTILENKKMVEN